MIPLSSFFEKFKALAQKESVFKGLIVSVLEKHTRILFTPKQIEREKGTIRITCKPIEKQLIFTHKEKILTEINQTLGPNTITHIH